MSRLRALVAALLVALGPAAARAAPVAFVAFVAPGTRFEGFEGLVVGPDVGLQLGFEGVYLPGYSGSYTFASGVTLIGPSVDVFPGDAFVHDFRSGSPPPNFWGANGTVNGPEDVLTGFAYLAVFEAGTAEAAIDLRFDEPMVRVGAFVTGDFGTTITLDVYDENDVLLESVSVGAVPIGGWGSNFLGIERSEGIRRVVFRGHDFGIDNLLFMASTTSVPEGPSGVLLATGLAALAVRRRRRAA